LAAQALEHRIERCAHMLVRIEYAVAEDGEARAAPASHVDQRSAERARPVAQRVRAQQRAQQAQQVASVLARQAFPDQPSGIEGGMNRHAYSASLRVQL